jgi:TolB protein
LSNKRRAIRHCLLILACCLSANAQAVLTIKITQGIESALPIAVVPFGGEGATVNVSEIIAADLQRSGRFKPMPAADMPAQPHEFSAINFRDWRLLGMENLVVGNVNTTAGGDYEIEFRLVDIYKGSQLIGYRIPATARNLRLAAHQIADIIFEKVTGEKGAFATRVAYVTVLRNGDKKTHALQIADTDGYNARTLLESPQPLLSPAWSPDGEQLAYVSFEERNSAIYIQDIRTGEREKISSGPGINSAPAWSPNGKYLAMTLSKDGNTEIYVLHMNGRRLQRMTTNVAIDTEASWAPDGNSLIFTSDRGGKPQIYQVDLLGGRATRLTYKGAYNTRASFSPDGKSITMVHGDDRGYHIAVMDLATGDVDVLTKGSLDESPSFAPNGSMIIYTTSAAGGSELAAVSVDGRVHQRLALQEGEVREPAWGPFRN